MKVLVACEYSGIVRDAFIRRGHDAISCDLLDTEVPGPHYKGDIMDALDWESGGYFSFLEYDKFDLIIAHPPCTALTVAGNRTYGENNADGYKERLASVEWTKSLWERLKASSKRVALENPVNVMQRLGGFPKPQYVQPWMFGHLEQKKTGLTLWNLPPLKETNNVYIEMMKLPKKERERIHYMSPGKDRWKERSRTFPGIAEAMAEQWGSLKD